MSRFGKEFRTFFIEEPVYAHDQEDHFSLSVDEDNSVTVVTPHLKAGVDKPEHDRIAYLLKQFMDENNIVDYGAWYYSPLALKFTEHLKPEITIYDCMDELSAFKDAAPEIPRYEHRLLEKADVVFTGGNALYSAKRSLHKNVYAFPSSIDKDHFAKARQRQEDRPDQMDIPFPRIGFFGVIDERLDIQLLESLSGLRPDWHFIMLGPVVKVDPKSLPQAKNIHYLGGKSYQELPAYLANWDIAFIPFARNESTRYISPTKTPEFLAGGKPVIATSIEDIVKPYGELGFVSLADTAETFVEAATAILSQPNRKEWLKRVDEFLEKTSWNKTFKAMNALISEMLEKKKSNIQSRNKTIYV